MFKSKTALEYAFYQLKDKVITSVWYKGKCTIQSEYHSTEEGLFLECEDGCVFHIYPADELRLKFIHGVYIKLIKYWEREKKQMKNLENVTLMWKHFTGKKIQESRLIWKNIAEHKLTLGHPKSRTDYPYGLELRFNETEYLYLDAMKIIALNKPPHLGYPEITIFFISKNRNQLLKKVEDS